MTGDAPRPGEAEAVTRVWASGLDLNCSGGEVRAIIANAYPEIAAAVQTEAYERGKADYAAELARLADNLRRRSTGTW